jgi:lipopolysaccharide export LptBFGC system permease protein LptF
MIYKIQRHLFFRTTKQFALFVLLIFFTFCLIDFCTRVSDFTDSSLGASFAFKYYGCEFAKRAHFFIPICFALTILLQFIHMTKAKEIIALLSSGMSYKKILRPFWYLAFTLGALLITIRHLVLPPSTLFLETYRNDHVRAVKKAKHASDEIFTLILKDDSKLIYQSYDAEKQRYFDLFWIVTPQRILRMKYLDKIEAGYKAHFIDELSRNQLGVFQKKHSFKELKLSKEWLKGAHLDKILPIQTHDITKLGKGLTSKDYIYSKDEIYTELLLVLIMSASPLWLLLMQAPMIRHYSRQIPVLFYVATQILFFFACATVLDGLGVIAQRSIASPWLLLFLPSMTMGFLLLRRYKKQLI